MSARGRAKVRAALFACSHAQVDKFFPRSVELARKTLAEGGKDSSRLEGFTRHGNRHTFASRRAMAERTC
jgi:hypothetical protein